MKFVNWLKGAFEHSTKGASARKWSAFIIVLMVVILHIKWFASDEWSYISIVLGLDYTFILCCLGLATWQYLKQPETKEPEKKQTDEAA